MFGVWVTAVGIITLPVTTLVVLFNVIKLPLLVVTAMVGVRAVVPPAKVILSPTTMPVVDPSVTKLLVPVITVAGTVWLELNV